MCDEVASCGVNSSENAEPPRVEPPGWAANVPRWQGQSPSFLGPPLAGSALLPGGPNSGLSTGSPQGGQGAWAGQSVCCRSRGENPLPSRLDLSAGRHIPSCEPGAGGARQDRQSSPDMFGAPPMEPVGVECSPCDPTAFAGQWAAGTPGGLETCPRACLPAGLREALLREGAELRGASRGGGRGAGRRRPRWLHLQPTERRR